MVLVTVMMTIRFCLKNKSRENDNKGLGISFETFSRDFDTGSSKVAFGSTPTVVSEDKITLNDQTVENKKRRRAIYEEVSSPSRRWQQVAVGSRESGGM